MGERSDRIREEIEVTRGEMGETVEAMSYKADVPARAKDWVAERKDAVVSTLGGAKDKATEVAAGVAAHKPEPGDVKRRAGSMRHTAERNPIGLLIAGAAAGFLAGMLSPSSRVEDEKLGPVADDLKSAAVETGQEAIERGKSVVQDAVESAAESVKARGGDETQELASSLRERVGDALPTESSAPAS